MPKSEVFGRQAPYAILFVHELYPMRHDDHGIAELLAWRRQPPVIAMVAPVTQWPRGRMTIAGLMVAVAVVAVLLALPAAVCAIAIALSIPYLSIIGTRWLVFRRHRRLAACSFWAAATMTNLIVAFSCIAPNMNSISFSLIPAALLVIAAPAIASLGRAWLVLLNGDEAIPHPLEERPAFRSWSWLSCRS